MVFRENELASGTGLKESFGSPVIGELVFVAISHPIAQFRRCAVIWRPLRLAFEVPTAQA